MIRPTSPVPKAAHTAPSPTVTVRAFERNVTSIGSTGSFVVGSTRTTVPTRPFATQTAPSPTATPVGVASSVIVLTRSCVAASMRDSVLSSWFATHTEPSPTATPHGLAPTWTVSTTLFDCGSTRATKFGFTTVPAPSPPCPSAKTGIATAAAGAPISAEAGYIRRRRRASSTSSVFSASNSLGRPSITSWDRRSGRSTSFSRRLPRSRIVTPDERALVLDELPRRRREQHLPAVACGPDARGLVDAHADVALLADPGLAGMKAHPHLDLYAFGPRVGLEVALRRHRGRDRVLPASGRR